jgi:hypothetical protein
VNRLQDGEQSASLANLYSPDQLSAQDFRATTIPINSHKQLRIEERIFRRERKIVCRHYEFNGRGQWAATGNAFSPNKVEEFIAALRLFAKRKELS